MNPVLEKIGNAIRQNQATDLFQNRALLIFGLGCLAIGIGVTIYLFVKARLQTNSRTQQTALESGHVPLNRV